ncbi:MAG TPA: aldehyde dehydrogenase family protein [Gordonia sp. (in: high G+C Gram-positive bacteria)]|uniref:aldehyde dehydrogenase family protein n=1 Tax=unclassified Gordonia (in: high G+C Gram-positive bacteria) TaxID=2657482 RepID=UPI000FBAF983|nr:MULTISPECIES: aldehyde dehydrogenase family protein [unclassified Gordonia (in: high G+C Gram-positive bacteria)]RUP40178.1 MAG: aldehyde dehydrogenase family protein [Gordonia sp. (in: high G+C Gram-positive bacteria)]HNP55853.1 aldehyde dehydrogenase family protein [Gordonia sp. (in: high G+C Gram-positive bacteria)]HRC50924.1 aldehyde dehydrogenase family protein [Gordonia sp. (in: high G+C Gram-positive bacteria)]
MSDPSEPTADHWRRRAAEATLPTQSFIGGAWCPAASGESFTVVNPATGKPLVEVAAGDTADIDAAVAAAAEAFPGWSGLSATERGTLLCRFADLIGDHIDELALLVTLEMGKPIGDSLTVEVPGAAAVFRYYGEVIDKLAGELPPTSDGSVAMVRRVPLGVVGAVVPWNFPLDIAAWKVAPALAAGNTVVLKPAEESPLSVLRLAELAIEAGIPPGVFNVVPGLGATAGRALGLHPGVACLTFTGSTEVGKMFLRYSGESNMKQVWLECGGKSPNVVFADCADLDKAATMACFGIFGNSGEVCSANSRLLVQREIADDFVAKIVEHAARYSPGDPLDPASAAGPIVSGKQLDQILHYAQVGAADGTLAMGGNRIGKSGYFMEPTVVTDLSADSAVVTDEIFGPVLAVIPFDSEEEAIALANDTPYGLAASVWTSNLDRALRVSEALHAGTVSVNTVDALSTGTPFGGFGASGFGPDLSVHAIDKFTGLKTTWLAKG